MKLNKGHHLAYCTNIHRGETWPETFHNLRTHTLEVRRRIAAGTRFAIGLRLSFEAATELSQGNNLKAFQQWMDENDLYVFTVNGFPYGTFHQTRVKENVYLPDWRDPLRVQYTKLLFDILAQIVTHETGGSVSTVPCSFKAFDVDSDGEKIMRNHLWDCVEHIDRLSQTTGRDLHLGLEPEPLCYLETTKESLDFFERMIADRPGDDRLQSRLGINYDACHLAVEYEDPGHSLQMLQDAKLRVSKIHLSNALKVRPSKAVFELLQSFADPVYFHQVIRKKKNGLLERIQDLDGALRLDPEGVVEEDEEWRIHFHIPLHAEPGEGYASTADHLHGVMDFLAREPSLCRHLEMETYTWDVMPGQLKNRDVVEQLVGEYRWTLHELSERGLGIGDTSQ